MKTADKVNHLDPLWELKGGGGSFGAVFSFEFRMHPVGPEIYFVLTVYPISETENVFSQNLKIAVDINQ